MSRFASIPASFILALAFTAVVAAQQPAASAPSGVTPADAAAFLGDWTLSVESQMGPTALALSIKTDAGKVVGEISSEMMPKAPISDISKVGTALVLKYSFDYQGNAVPVVVTLSPTADKIGASLDFAGGAFVMAGTAAKAAK